MGPREHKEPPIRAHSNPSPCSYKYSTLQQTGAERPCSSYTEPTLFLTSDLPFLGQGRSSATEGLHTRSVFWWLRWWNVSKATPNISQTPLKAERERERQLQLVISLWLNELPCYILPYISVIWFFLARHKKKKKKLKQQNLVRIKWIIYSNKIKIQQTLLMHIHI